MFKEGKSPLAPKRKLTHPQNFLAVSIFFADSITVPLADQEVDLRPAIGDVPIVAQGDHCQNSQDKDKNFQQDND